MSTIVHGPPLRDKNPCRHSREPFSALFACIAERRDLSLGAKVLHATLVSRHRIGADWTQAEIGDRMGVSRHKVWRLTAELVAAGLLLVVRLGQGRANQYVLLGIDSADLDGSAARGGAGHQDARRPAGSTRNRSRQERKSEEWTGTGTDLASAVLDDWQQKAARYTSGPWGALVRT